MNNSLHSRNKMFALMLLIFAFASSLPARVPGSGKNVSPIAVVQPNNGDAMRIEGEQRFRANCGRCHAAPQKFPARMMATVLRHMRVRATITDEDRRLILFYMTQ